MRKLAVMVVSACCLLLQVSCGGGGDDGPERVASAATSQCEGGVDVHDNGRIVYLLLDRACNPSGAIDFTLNVVTREGRLDTQLRLPSLGESMPFEPATGFSRRVSAYRKGSWVEHPNTDSWGWRDGAGLLVKDGRLYLLGGYRGGIASLYGSNQEVWVSDDVRAWTRLLEFAPWPGRHGAGWVVHANRLWVIGGDFFDDAWSSADGIHWTQHAQAAPFGRRYTPNAVSDGQRIFLYAGQTWAPYETCAFLPECEAVGLNDVWSSTDGAQWNVASPAAPWEGRGLVHGGAFFRGRIYLVGGGLKLAEPGSDRAETVKEYADIWSSADGVQWRREATELGFTPRTHFSITAAPYGCYVSDGSVGIQANLSSDLFFAADCVHYAPVPDTPPLPPRHASSMAYFNGSLVILGGPPYEQFAQTAGTAVWQYFPDVSSQSSP